MHEDSLTFEVIQYLLMRMVYFVAFIAVSDDGCNSCVWRLDFVLIVSFDLLHERAAFSHVFGPRFLIVGSSILSDRHSSWVCAEEQRAGALQRSLHQNMQYDASLHSWCHDRRLSPVSSPLFVSFLLSMSNIATANFLSIVVPVSCSSIAFLTAHLYPLHNHQNHRRGAVSLIGPSVDRLTSSSQLPLLHNWERCGLICVYKYIYLCRLYC